MVTIRQLQTLLPDVTTMTIHRDLDELEEIGLLVKMRGGARAAQYEGDPIFAAREHMNIKEKELIAKKALPLITPNSSIFLDAGTTNLALARKLPDYNLTIFTTGANFSYELARLHNASVQICGGSLNRLNLAISGFSTLAMLEKVNIDIAFIGVSGYLDGFTCGKESEMLVKQAVIEKARKSVLLMDASKMGKLMPYTFAALADIAYVITNAALPEAFMRAAAEAGVTVL